MLSPLFVYAFIGLTAVSFCFLRTWTSILILAFAELAWISLCSYFGYLMIYLNDSFFLFWSLALLFFSAVELAVTSVLFLSQEVQESNSVVNQQRNKQVL